jgi:hypothetical protein
VEFAREEFKLAPDREDLESIEGNSAKARGILDNAPQCPLETAYLWSWFHEINGGRTCGMAANPLQFTEIEAWSRLTGNTPNPWEVSLLKRLDTAFLQVTAPKPT